MLVKQMTIVASVCAAVGTASTADAAIVQSFNFTGSNQSFVVPVGTTSLDVQIWGAGGGHGGGAGGFVGGTLTVSPGQTLTLAVGGGGTVTSATVSLFTTLSAFRGGGPATQVPFGPVSGGGGGLSGIFLNAVPLAIAGGGGGGSANGFGGGGSINGSTVLPTGPGAGGPATANAGGFGGSSLGLLGSPGSFLAGGSGSSTFATGNGGGGGGGGYFGGGGGARGGAGGGGLTFVNENALYPSSYGPGQVGSAAGASTSFTHLPTYVPGIARGGALGSAGGAGLIVISYTVPSPSTVALLALGGLLTTRRRRA